MSQTIEERIKENKDAIDAWKDLPQFGKFKDGENTIQINASIPVREKIGQFGKEHLYTATLNGEIVQINLPKSVEIPILKGLTKKKSTFTVTKKGSGMSTRYNVK